MGKVRRPIERVDAPAQTVLFTLAAAFLRQHGDLRCGGLQILQNKRFGCKIRIGDKVPCPPFALDAGDPPVVAHQFCPTPLCSLLRHLGELGQHLGTELGLLSSALADGVRHRHSSSRGRPLRTEPRPK